MLSTNQRHIFNVNNLKANFFKLKLNNKKYNLTPTRVDTRKIKMTHKE